MVNVWNKDTNRRTVCDVASVAFRVFSALASLGNPTKPHTSCQTQVLTAVMRQTSFGITWHVKCGIIDVSKEPATTVFGV